MASMMRYKMQPTIGMLFFHSTGSTKWAFTVFGICILVSIIIDTPNLNETSPQNRLAHLLCYIFDRFAVGVQYSMAACMAAREGSRLDSMLPSRPRSNAPICGDFSGALGRR